MLCVILPMKVLIFIMKIIFEVLSLSHAYLVQCLAGGGKMISIYIHQICS